MFVLDLHKHDVCDFTVYGQIEGRWLFDTVAEPKSFPILQESGVN